MALAQWNLDTIELTSLEITEISITGPPVDDDSDIFMFRLLVLSLQLSKFGVPAIYLRDPPSYFPRKSENRSINSVVLAFDIFNTLKLFKLPSWCNYDTQPMMICEFDTEEMQDHYNRALVLLNFYKEINYSPIYFTTFIIFPGNNLSSEPILLQKVSVKREDRIMFRTLIFSSLQMIINPRFELPANSYLLVPPFEHPFRLLSTENTKLTILYIDKSIYVINSAKHDFVYLTNPPLLLDKFFMTNDSVTTEPKNLDIEFSTQSFFNYSETDIDSFLSKRFNSDDKLNSIEAKSSDEFIYPKFTFKEAVSNLISNKTERKHYMYFDKYIQAFPSQRYDINIPKLNDNLIFTDGFASSSQLKTTKSFPFTVKLPCLFRSFGIPNLVVNKNGIKCSVSASKVIDDWNRMHYKPIFGAKDVYYIVFSDILSSNLISNFFRDLGSVYNSYGFGKFDPYPSKDPVCFTKSQNILKSVDDFFSNIPLHEFKMIPLITFIIGKEEINFKYHSYFIFLNPDIIKNVNEDVFSTMAFDIYRKIRVYSPGPFGAIEDLNNEIKKGFFGFRCQPTFLLESLSQKLIIHITWDYQKLISCITDNRGSILHKTRHTTIKDIRIMINDAKELFDGMSLSSTLTIISEGITQELFNEIDNELEKIPLYTFYPAPFIQVDIPSVEKEDGLIFTQVEQIFSGKFLKPLVTCVVASQKKQTYTISLYRKTDNRSNEDTLSEFAKSMSYLSWLSVKPGSTEREISYPPHIAEILKINNMRTDALSRFEFLPQTEPN